MGTEELGDTKLHEAVRLGDLEETRLALKEGFDPNQIGIYQWSALHEASNNGDIDIVEYLIQYYGDPNKADLLCGSTAVHYAASQGHVECLELLLAAGGRHDILNNEGKSPLDVSDETCRGLLQKQRDKNKSPASPCLGDKNNHIAPPPRDILLETILADTRPHDTNNNSNQGNQPGHPGHHGNHGNQADDIQSGSGADIKAEEDSISVMDSAGADSISEALSWGSNSSSSSRPHSRAWGVDRIVGMKKEPVLGHIMLSFEFNAKKSTFKIRVWRVMDLLLPPPDKSMISSIYVKSYLQPDKRKQTKRKTEEVRVESVVSKDTTATSEIFKPVSFDFTKGLEYDGITQTMVNQKFVELEVCITQRYTRKSFVVATWNLPLSMAARKLRKERYPLKPCISTRVPANMAVYNGSGMERLRTHTTHSHSMSSLDSWATPYLPTEVVVEHSDSVKACSIEISIGQEEGEEEEEEGLQEALHQIAVMERKELNGESLEMSCVSLPEEADGPEGISLHSPLSTTQVQIHMPQQTDTSIATATPAKKGSLGLDYAADAIETNFSRHHGSGKDTQKVSKGKSDIQRPRGSSKGTSEKLKGSGKPSNKVRGHDLDQISIDQSDNLCWDDYEEPPTFTYIPMTFEEDAVDGLHGNPGERRSLVLPMATDFEVPEVHRSFLRTGSIEKDYTSAKNPATDIEQKPGAEIKGVRSKKSKKKQVLEDEESYIGMQSFDSDILRLKSTSCLKQNKSDSLSVHGKVGEISPEVAHGDLDEESSIGTHGSPSSDVIKVEYTTEPKPVSSVPKVKPQNVKKPKRLDMTLVHQSKRDRLSAGQSGINSSNAASLLANRDSNGDHMTKSTEKLMTMDLSESSRNKQGIVHIVFDDDWEEGEV